MFICKQAGNNNSLEESEKYREMAAAAARVLIYMSATSGAVISSLL